LLAFICVISIGSSLKVCYFFKIVAEWCCDLVACHFMVIYFLRSPPSLFESGLP
jgi:hypothetical protein